MGFHIEVFGLTKEQLLDDDSYEYKYWDNFKWLDGEKYSLTYELTSWLHENKADKEVSKEKPYEYQGGRSCYYHLLEKKDLKDIIKSKCFHKSILKKWLKLMRKYKYEYLLTYIDF